MTVTIKEHKLGFETKVSLEELLACAAHENIKSMAEDLSRFLIKALESNPELEYDFTQLLDDINTNHFIGYSVEITP